MNIKTIATRGGHSLDVRGASGILDEVTEDRKITPYVDSSLIAGGYNVIDVTTAYTGTSAVDLTTAMNKAKNAGADLFVSIHLNACDKISHGTEVIYDSFTKDMADRIVAQMASLGFYSRGTYADRRGLYEFNASPNLPNIIVECFFIDNAGDVNLYSKVGPAAVGRKIAEGIMGKSVVLSSPPPVANNPLNNVASTVPLESVSKLQTTLNQLGFTDASGAVLKVDGGFGPRTAEAVKKFQAAVGLNVDGAPGPNTWNAINAILARPLCIAGSSNTLVVKYIQWILGGLKVDGDFGPATVTRVKGWQSAKGLVVDGRFGPNSWTRLLG